ncbi:MAG: multidrug effflux MFS transporter [Burkholderiales bacterium]
MSRSYYRLALVLGLISATGPFAIDMYLPALPAIAADLHASPAAVQMSLMVFFIASGSSQLLWGPAADVFGRKAPLYAGLVLYCIGGIGCALAGNITALVGWRFVQGVGSAAGMSVPRAVVRDLYTGHEAARLMSLLMLVFSVAPILAPMVGSLLVEFSGWRTVFWLVTGVGLIALAIAVWALDETRSPAQRTQASLGHVLAAYATLLRDRHFLGVSFIGAFGISTFFVYLANSSFVLIEHFGLSTRGYAVAFAANAACFIGAAQFNGHLGQRLGLARLVRWGIAGCAGMMVVLCLLVLAGVDNVALMIGLMSLGFGCLGVVVPTSAVLALEAHGARAGTAAALLGMLQLLTGAAVIAVVGLFLDGSAVPMAAGMAATSGTAFVLAWRTLRPRVAAALAS